MEQLREFSARAKKKRLDALAADADDLRDFQVRRTLRVRKPQDLALQRLELRQRLHQISTRFKSVRRGLEVIWKGNVGSAPLPPAVIAREVRRDAKKRVASMRFALVMRSRAIETEES